MKCPYETLAQTGCVFKDTCKVDFKQYDSLWRRKLTCWLKLIYPRINASPPPHPQATLCCPSLPHASLIRKKSIILAEQVLRGCRITSSGTGAKGRADPAIWECHCDLRTCVLQFGKEVYVLYRQPYRMRDTAETGHVHIYSSPLPSQPLGSL